MHQIHPSLEALAEPIGSLAALPGNARRGDVEAVKRSYVRFGQRKPIVGRVADRTVLAGNHQLQAALELGWDQIAVVWADDDEATGKAFALADNRTSDLGSYDDDALLKLLLAVQSEGDDGLLAATGFDDAALQALIASENQVVPLNDADDVPVAPKLAVSTLGDVWELGPHRVLCGNSTEPTDRALVMGGALADMVFTDPPYGVDYQGRLGASPVAGWTKEQHDSYSKSRRKDGLKVSNDNLGLDGTRRLVADAFTGIPLKPGGAFYVCAPPGDMEMAFRLGLLDADTPMRHSIVWVKDQFTFGRSDYHYRHESILYGWIAGGAHYFINDRTQDSVWEVPRPRKSKEHPTMKPIALVVRAITNSSKVGETILDLFGGSGSTLIAAHDTGRVARLVEIDPVYVDVICRRFQEHTGILPTLNGTPHDFTEGT
jgi:DNA modification methylase